MTQTWGHVHDLLHFDRENGPVSQFAKSSSRVGSLQIARGAAAHALAACATTQADTGLAPRLTLVAHFMTLIVEHSLQKVWRDEHLERGCTTLDSSAAGSSAARLVRELLSRSVLCNRDHSL